MCQGLTTQRITYHPSNHFSNYSSNKQTQLIDKSYLPLFRLDYNRTKSYHFWSLNQKMPNVNTFLSNISWLRTWRRLPVGFWFSARTYRFCLVYVCYVIRKNNSSDIDSVFSVDYCDWALHCLLREIISSMEFAVFQKYEETIQHGSFLCCQILKRFQSGYFNLIRHKVIWLLCIYFYWHP